MIEIPGLEDEAVTISDVTLEKIFAFRDRFVNKYGGIEFYPYQKEPSNKIIEAALTGRGLDFYIEISRQAGKTEMVVWTMVFLLCFIKDIFAFLKIDLGTTGWYSVIGAPQQEQAKTDFDRIKDYLRLVSKDLGIGFGEANSTTLKLSNGNITYCFPISKTAHIESKTAHFLLNEEAQDTPDAERNKKLIPMGASTDASIVYIGTAGYTLCDFYRGINSGEKGHAFKYDCWEVIRQKREAFNRDGNPWHLKYERFVRRQISKHGEHNPEIKSQFFLEWQLEKGMWMTEEVFNSLINSKLDLDRDYKGEVHVGMDVAKDSDTTFVTVWKIAGYKDIVRKVPGTQNVEEDNPEYDENASYDPKFGGPPEKLTRVESIVEEEMIRAPVYRLINWFMIRGVLYQEQWEAIDHFLNPYTVYKMNIDSTGVGDATADYYVTKYNGWNYDTLKRMERIGQRGIVRPVKFTAQSKHQMYVNFEIAIKEGRVEIPGCLESFSPSELECFKRFKVENLNALREWKGSLLSVRHPDGSKGESGDVETDDSVDSSALVFFDPTLEPIGYEVAGF